MDLGKILTVVFGAVASCAAVHIGFAALGIEPLLHAAAESLTGVAHDCGLDHVFNEASGAGASESLPDFSFEGDSLVPAK